MNNKHTKESMNLNHLEKEDLLAAGVDLAKKRYHEGVVDTEARYRLLVKVVQDYTVGLKKENHSSDSWMGRFLDALEVVKRN